MSNIEVFRQSRDYLYGWVARVDGEIVQSTASPTRKRAVERANEYIARGGKEGADQRYHDRWARP